MEKPYLDFYADQGADLVSRNVEDKETFFRSRESLYLTLGIPPGLLKGKSVIEFGPGTGHNALYTDWLEPSLYVLVDGGEAILSASKNRLEVDGRNSVERHYICSLFEDYSCEDEYDLVIAEGCIPNQINPIALFQKLLEFVRPQGIMMFTTVSAASWLSEIIRRLVKTRLVPIDTPFNEQVEYLLPIFNEHFAALSSMGRTGESWILDNLVQPLSLGKLFTIPDAVDNLPDPFEIVATAPRFSLDWTWYKDVAESKEEKNNVFLTSYYRNVINMMDRRSVVPSHDYELGVQIEDLASRIWMDLCLIEQGNSSAWSVVLNNLSELRNCIERVSPGTAKAIQEAHEWIDHGSVASPLNYFPSWWGRGQQHVSIVRTSQ